VGHTWDMSHYSQH